MLNKVAFIAFQLLPPCEHLCRRIIFEIFECARIGENETLVDGRPLGRSRAIELRILEASYRRSGKGSGARGCLALCRKIGKGAIVQCSRRKIGLGHGGRIRSTLAIAILWCLCSGYEYFQAHGLRGGIAHPRRTAVVSSRTERHGPEG